jgi:hypothetical protein
MHHLNNRNQRIPAGRAKRSESRHCSAFASVGSALAYRSPLTPIGCQFIEQLRGTVVREAADAAGQFVTVAHAVNRDEMARVGLAVSKDVF